jgi:hypothetical protein
MAVRVGADLGVVGDDRVPSLVVGGDGVGLFVRQPRAPLGAHQHLVPRVLQVLHAHCLGAIYRCPRNIIDYSSLLAQVRIEELYCVK